LLLSQQLLLLSLQLLLLNQQLLLLPQQLLLFYQQLCCFLSRATAQQLLLSFPLLLSQQICFSLLELFVDEQRLLTPDMLSVLIS
jgi:hypothetical protein